MMLYVYFLADTHGTVADLALMELGGLLTSFLFACAGQHHDSLGYSTLIQLIS